MDVENFYESGKRKQLTPKRRMQLFLEHGGRCCVCGGKIHATHERWIVEHVIPIADFDGEKDANVWENLAPAHFKCAKAKTADEASGRAKLRRAAEKHFGAKPRKRSSFQTNRDGPFKAKIGGGVERRK